MCVFYTFQNDGWIEQRIIALGMVKKKKEKKRGYSAGYFPFVLPYLLSSLFLHCSLPCEAGKQNIPEAYFDMLLWFGFGWVEVLIVVEERRQEMYRLSKLYASTKGHSFIKFSPFILNWVVYSLLPPWVIQVVRVESGEGVVGYLEPTISGQYHLHIYIYIYIQVYIYV